MRRLVLGAALVLPTAAAAQFDPPADTGARLAPISVSVSPYVSASIWSRLLSADVHHHGTGFGFSIGYDFVDIVGIHGDVSITESSLEPGSAYRIWQVEPLIRVAPWGVRIAGPVRLVPFADIGGGLVRAGGSRPVLGGVENVTYSGSFVTVGAGLKVTLPRHLELSGSTHITTGAFSDRKVGNVTTSTLSIRASTSRSAVALAWYPFRARAEARGTDRRAGR